MEFEDVLVVHHFRSLGTPEQFQIGGQHLASHFRIDNLIDFSGIAHVGISHDALRAVGHQLQHGQQRMLLLGSSHLSVAHGACGSLLVVFLDFKLGLFLCLGSLYLCGVGSNGCGVGHARVLVGNALVEL